MELSSSSSSLPTTTSGTGELFICFTSRLSSSMKITSKSILSPGRAAGVRDSSQISLSSSLSRRLKTSGSLKGGQASPAMFPTTVTGNSKKRSSCSSGFENPEPSSPKVTCIGQVRVKTKKQGKKMRYRSSKRRSNNSNNNGGEASFRRAEKGGGEESEAKSFEEDQKMEENKWVTICEALRGFGAEFNCFLPCRSSCMTTKQTNNDANKAEKRISSTSASNNGRSCGAVFARWLVALQDGDGKGREIELVVGDEEEDHKEEDEMKGSGRSLRRRVFEGIEFKEEEIMGSFNENDKVGDSNNNSGDEGEEAGRVSICIPPKNALLLMRCRSDPVKMAALANRFWEPPLKDEEDEDEEEDEEKHEDVNEEEKCENQASDICCEKCDSSPCNDIGQTGAEEEEEKPELAEEPKMVSEKEDVEQVVVAVVEEEVVEVEEQENTMRTSTEEEDFQVVVREQQEDEGAEKEEEEKENNGDVRKEVEEEEEEEEKEAKILVDLEEMVEEEEVNESHCEEEREMEDKEIEKEGQEEERNEKPISSLASEEVEQHKEEEEDVAEESTEEEEEKTGRGDPKEEGKVEMGPPGLPDCLLLMMCEPKLSMEVSKETWVCSTDFIRWLPDRRRANAKKGGPEEPKKRPITATVLDDGNGGGGGPMSNPVPPAQLMQPPRSSCSFPLTASVAAAAPQSMASVIERKSVGTKPPYEQFVLTRCKSEPMRSAAKLAPDACFWKNRKIEPHRPATLGVGAAGVGF